MRWFVILMLVWLAGCASYKPADSVANPHEDEDQRQDGASGGSSSGPGSSTGKHGKSGKGSKSQGSGSSDPLGGLVELVSLERYPRMVMPHEMAKGVQATVFVGLATAPSQATELTVVIEGETAEDGAMRIELPKLEDGEDAWPIDVILSAPDFTIAGDDFETINLPLGDRPSTLASFQITLASVPASGEAPVQAFLFHEGAFIGQIGRTVRAVESLTTAAPKVTETRQSATAVRRPSPSHEIHLIALDDQRALVVINEPGKTMAHAVVDFDSGSVSGFVTPKYGQIRARGLDAAPSPEGDQVGMAMVRGLGTQLWGLTPAPVREHLLRIYDDPSVESLRVYTNLPSFPWELLRPQTTDGTALAALGHRFRLGRWHLRMGMSGLAVPPERVRYDELVAMVPTYEGRESLPAVERELAALRSVNGFRKVPGRSTSVAELVKNPPNGVLHFAGHGQAQPSADASTLYALRLEDGAFDALAFKGLEGKRLRESETLVFFNACELGQADAMATIVEGWAPAMLDAGAAGYIGALWPVGDAEAASFAEAFYAEVEQSLKAQGEASVTEILRCLRRRGADRADPTWQAYLFYGDPDTVLVREGAQVEGAPAYRCE